MSVTRILTRPLRVVRARTRTALDRRRHHAEIARGASLPARADRTPIFILGAPRSGTTLLYQLVVEGLEVGWLANAHLERPGGVSELERTDRPRAARTPSTWTSTYGATREPWEPNEAGEFWYRFVPRMPHELNGADATDVRTSAIRAAVREFADACAAPLVFKNVYNSLRVPVLAAALPEARFLVIERDLEDNARSILVGRERNGGLDSWLSARPAGAEALDSANPAEQAVWQVRRINEVARRELGTLDPARSMTATYDDLCAEPATVLDRVSAWLAESGADVTRRADAQLPDHFDRTGGGVLDPALEAQLQAAVRA